MYDKTKYADEIWVSDIKGASGAFLNPELNGVNVKFRSGDWPPNSHAVPIIADEDYDNLFEHSIGKPIPQTGMPEAACVFNDKHFAKVGDFIWLDGFTGFRGKLADILKHADLGEGGELVPVPVYHADQKSLTGEKFFVPNWGKHNINSLVYSESKSLAPFAMDIKTSIAPIKEFDVAVNQDSFLAPDMWGESKFNGAMFFKGWLAHAIIDAEIQPSNLALTRCRIV